MQPGAAVPPSPPGQAEPGLAADPDMAGPAGLDHPLRQVAHHPARPRMSHGHSAHGECRAVVKISGRGMEPFPLMMATYVVRPTAMTVSSRRIVNESVSEGRA